MRLTIYDLKPSYRIKMKYNDAEFLLLTNGRLANITTGDCGLHIQDNLDIVESVYTNKGEQIAIRVKNELIRYDKTKHDDTISDIKRRNDFLSFEELEFYLLREKVSHPRLLFVDFAKTRNNKYKTKLGDVNSQMWIAEFSGSQKIQNGYKKVTIRLKKYLIDKKDNLYLYKVDVFGAIF